MKARCIMKKTNKGYVAECLELSLAVREKTRQGCKDKLENAIEEYIKTLIMVHQDNENIIIRPVAFYPIRKIIFDIQYYFFYRNKDKKGDKIGRNFELIQTGEVPVAILN